MFKRIIILNLLFLAGISCEYADEQQLLSELHRLEWSRIADTMAYQPFRKSESARLRAALCLSIGKIQSSELFPVLAELISDTESQVVRNAIFALGQMRDDQSAALLIRLSNDPIFDTYRKDIIQALGKSETDMAYEFLLKDMENLQDTLLSAAIKGITFLTDDKTRNRSAAAIKKFLDSPVSDVRASAVYYFARHADPSVVSPLIRMEPAQDDLTRKYRLRAIDRSINTKHDLTADSSLKDSLWREVRDAIRKSDNAWQTRLYQIGILGNFDDSLSIALIAGQLKDTTAHIRLKAIQILGDKNTGNAQKNLLNYYNQATWGEKGNIIYTISKHDRNLAYRLVQQNLDQGTLHFKQLLLRSLGRIRDRASITQLKQFLQVPNVRLQQTAFMELSGLKLIQYNQVLPMLDSQDMVLIWLAADWITNHPDKAELNDLIKTYNQLNEINDQDAMMALLSAMSAMKDRAAIPFLKTTLEHTKRKAIMDQIVKMLTAFDVTIEALPQTRDSLFIPPEIINSKFTAQIETEKGVIVIELRPDLAPLTVSNFVYLVRKGFYQNITFHRIVSDFVIQAGDPRGDGWGGPGYNIPCEYNLAHFVRGTVGMATAGKDTGGSQFFICHSPQPHLDRRYTVFGQVISGMEIVDKIDIDDKIIQITTSN